jgi:ectoine hydroxylase-related dioxygenase (phytanoyl-CoA dioxygenase family)
LNRELPYPITAEHIEAYRRDGVVLLKGLLDAEWIERMQAAIARVSLDPGRYGTLGPSNGAMLSVCYMWQNDPDFRAFVETSPIAEAVGKVIGAQWIRMYHDHLFVKPPQSPAIMPWHCDETAWPVSGEMAPNIWTAFSPVNAENGRIEYIGGFHRHCVEQGLTFGFRPDQADGLCPNFEDERGNPDFPYRFISFDMEPGDSVIFHPHTPHFSKGNASATLERAGLAIRLFGDDVRWRNAPYKAAIPGLAATPEGEHPDAEMLPILWRRDDVSASAATPA